MPLFVGGDHQKLPVGIAALPFHDVAAEIVTRGSGIPQHLRLQFAESVESGPRIMRSSFGRFCGHLPQPRRGKADFGSRAVEDGGQPARLFVFALEGAPHCGERISEREDFTANQQVGIFSSYRMPIDTLGRDRDFRHQICACQGETSGRKAPQSNTPDNPVLFSDLMGIEENPELVGL